MKTQVMHLEIIESACGYAAHAVNCEICNAVGPEMCKEGLETLSKFQDALNADAVRDIKRYDFLGRKK